MKKVNRFVIYIIGMLILALGLSLSTKLSLGVSALMSLPFMLSEVYDLNFGDITFYYYIFVIIVEIIIHLVRKDYKTIIKDVLSIVLSLVFTRVLNIYGSIIPNAGDNMVLRISLMLLSIVFVGVGAAITIDSKLILNPCDGFVSTIAEASKKNLGNVKNICDITCVAITIIFSYIKTGKIIGVGLGTILSMIFVGRVIHFFNKHFEKKLKGIMGVS